LLLAKKKKVLSDIVNYCLEQVSVRLKKGPNHHFKRR